MVKVLRTGYRIPFSLPPPLSRVPIPLPSYSPNSVKGEALRGEVPSLIEKGTVEFFPSFPGYYSHLFVVWMATGSWRTVIDLSHLNHFVLQMRFKMETSQSVLCAVRRGDWIVSIDLKYAYLRIPVHPDSRQFLGFVVFENTYQFEALCFGLFIALKMFTRVMAPVSVMLHDLGVRILQYQDDWLVLASSWKESQWARDIVLNLCRQAHQVSSQSLSDCNVSGYDDREPLFEGFPLSRQDFDHVVTARRIFILQAAKRCCLAKSAGSPVVAVPGGRLWMRSFSWYILCN